MHQVRSLVVVLVGMAAALPSPAPAAEPETYALDPVHTRVMFAIGHAGFSSAIGTVPGSTGMLVFDRTDWRSARLDVRVPLTRLELGDAKWNAAALATNLLDGERHPEARFISTQVDPVDADHARVCGQLTLRGVSRPLCMDVTLNALKRHPMPPFRRTAGFSATATLSRSEYGISAWKSVIGDAVELRIEVEAVRSDNVESDSAEIGPRPEADPGEPASPEPTSDPSTPASPEPIAGPAR